MTPDTSVPWGTIIAIGVPAFAAFGAVIVFFVKRLLRSQDTISELKFKALSGKDDSVDQRVRDLAAAHEKIRDKWDEFMREYLKIDSTRGQKIDALFRLVDQMQDTLRDIRPAINTKVEDAFARALSELKVYIRDHTREDKNA